MFEPPQYLLLISYWLAVGASLFFLTVSDDTRSVG
jgi:hypothetical protein